MFNKLNQSIIECVPNISEGRDKEVVAKIVEAASSVSGAAVIHQDSGFDTNRTVITIAGLPLAVAEAAFRLVERAVELIDMSKHQGAHPRLGAVDVCPFIPLCNFSFQECVSLSRDLASRLANSLSIPIYLYGKAAVHEQRVNLKHIRSGQYEGLFEKLKRPEWVPDFGPKEFNSKTGAVTVGVRDILIAYNVNLSTADLSIAKRIAKQVRERQLLPGTQSLGWYLQSYNIAQVSYNLHDFRRTGLRDVYDCTAELAKAEGVEVTGSELVGLAPASALLDCDNTNSVPQSDFVRMEDAINYLGLNSLRPFSIDEQILEWRLDAFADSFR